MDSDYRVFMVRRMFMADLQLIEKVGEDFDILHFNPLKRDFIEKVMVQGSFWAVYDEDTVVAVNYIMPGDCAVFKEMTACWEISDLLGNNLSDCLICGYVWKNNEYKCKDMYGALCRLWTMQAKRLDKGVIVHYMPRSTDTDMEKLFYNGFELAGLRGLDNLVPHYIFTRPSEMKKRAVEIYRDIKSCRSTDTLNISKLCEKGYRGFDIDRQENLIFRR